MTMPDAPRDFGFRLPERSGDVASTKRTVRCFLYIFAFSLLIRMVALFFLRHSPLASDAQDYRSMAEQFLSHKPFVPYWPPGLPLFLVPFVAAGASLWVLRASMLLFWLLCSWGLYRLLRELRQEQNAWLVLLLFAVLPDSIQLSIEPLTAMPIAAFLMIALSAALRILRRGCLVEYVLLGCSLGLMSLIRPSSLPLLILIPFFLAVLRRAFYAAISSAALGLVMVGAWVLYAHAMSGMWVINTANATNVYYGNNAWTPLYRTWYFGSHAKLGTEEIKQYPEYEHELEHLRSLSEPAQSSELTRLVRRSIAEHPGLFVLRTMNRVRCFFGFDTFTAAGMKGTRWGAIPASILVLGLEALTYLALVCPSVFWIAGTTRLFWRSPSTILLSTTIVMYAIPYWLSMSHPTYNFPVILPLVALGLAARSAVRERDSHRWLSWTCLAVLLLIQVEWVWQMSASMSQASRALSVNGTTSTMRTANPVATSWETTTATVSRHRQSG